MKLEECYRSLGLKPGASREQVKVAYRTLARKFHPDTGTHHPSISQSASQSISQSASQSISQSISQSASQKPHKVAPPPDTFIQITAAYKYLLQSFPVESAPAPVSDPRSNSPEDLLKYQAYQRLRQLFAQQRFANAIALVEALNTRLPDDLEVQQWRAIAYQQQGRYLAQAYQYSQALRYLQKALTINPTNRTLVATLHQDLKSLQRRVKQNPRRSS